MPSKKKHTGQSKAQPRRAADLKKSEDKAGIQRNQAEQLLRDLLANSPTGLYIVQDGCFRLVSPAFQRILGYSEDELIGAPSLQFVLADDREMVRENAIKMLKGERFSAYEFRVVTKGSEVKWITETVIPVQYHGKRAALGHFIDVTERRRLEDKILYLNETRETIRRINQLILRTDNEPELLQAACQQLIDSRTYAMAWIGFIESGSYDVLPVAQAGFEDGYLSSIKVTWDDSPYGRGPTGTAIKTGQPSLMRDIPNDPQYQSWREQALKRGYQSSFAVPLAIRGRVIGALNVYSKHADAFDDAECNLLVELAGDISVGIEKIRQWEARKQAERELYLAQESFRNSLDVSPSGILVADAKWNILYANPALVDIYGCSSLDELKATPVQNRYTAESYAGYLERREKALRGEPIPGHYEVSIIRKDGEVRHLEITRTNIIWYGKPQTAVIYHDITERQRAEERDHELEMLKELDRLRSELLANISHELRTPLASIKGFISTLLRTDVKWSVAQQLDFLHTADHETDRLTRLVSDILDISRLDAGAMKLNKASHHIAEILDSVSPRLSRLAERHRLKVEVPPDLPFIYVDEMRIGQVLANLIDNAAKFSPADTEIKVEAQLAGDEVIVSVIDHGEGIPAEFLPRLFDRFYQAESIARGRGSGTGLGLSICRGIVEAHGGRIWVASKLKEGSKFSFSLPVSKGDEQIEKSAGN